MHVTLCDTACGNEAVASADKVTCRIAVGEVRFRISIEVTKPKKKFYRHFDLCEPCLNWLELQLKELLSSLMGFENRRDDEEEIASQEGILSEE